MHEAILIPEGGVACRNAPYLTARFLESCCYFHCGSLVSMRGLYPAYVAFCVKNGGEFYTLTDFAVDLESRGYSRKFCKDGACYLEGIGMLHALPNEKALSEVLAEESDMEGSDALKLHLDSQQAFSDASHAEARLRCLLTSHSLVLYPEAQKAARDCLEALDRLDNLGRKARALGV